MTEFDRLKELLRLERAGRNGLMVQLSEELGIPITLREEDVIDAIRALRAEKRRA